jgi:hypothetical protein
MRYVDSEITVKGGTKFPGAEHKVTISTPQVETPSDAEKFFGGQDGIVVALNKFLDNRAPSGFRTKLFTFIKNAADWAKVVAYANEQAPVVRDYAFSTDRGPSKAHIVDVVRNTPKEKIDAMSADELRSLWNSMRGN